MACVVCRPVWFVAAFSVAIGGCTRENPAFDRHASVEETAGGASTEAMDGSTSRGGNETSATGWEETGIDPTERMTSSDDGTPADDGDPMGCVSESGRQPECKTGDVQPCNVGAGERTCIDCQWDISACCECEDGDQKSCHELEAFDGQGFVVCNGCQWEILDEDFGCCRSPGSLCEPGLVDCCTGTSCELDGLERRCLAVQ